MPEASTFAVMYIALGVTAALSGHRQEATG
jgi:hypothetical protein